jgi:(p)ppGpp synthase/HD superfamily hydrolase
MMNLLEKAIELAVRAHAGQQDEDSMPHVVHCIEVMLATKRATEISGTFNHGMLREMGFNLPAWNNEPDADEAAKQLLNELMIAAVLHDTIEDTFVTLDVIEEMFGKNVRDLVDGVSRRVSPDGTKESYRDFIYRAKQIPGSRLIKIADLNHNYGRSSKIKKASWRDKLQYKYRIALSVLNDVDEPTWEQVSAFAKFDGGTDRHYFVADPNGKQIEITEEEFKSLSKGSHLTKPS